MMTTASFEVADESVPAFVSRNSFTRVSPPALLNPDDLAGCAMVLLG